MATLSSSSTDALRATLPDLADDIIAAIANEVPDYARAMEGRFGEVVRFGVEVALNRFVDVLGGAAPKSESSARDTYVRLGAGEYRAGRTLDALLAAYRVGAKLAWRRFVEAGTRAGFAPDALYDLGEAMFAYIDEISAESAAGFAEAQSEAAGESQRRRRSLVRLLAQEPPAAEETLRTAAQSAGWTLPRRVAAVVVGRGRAARGHRRARQRRGAPGAAARPGRRRRGRRRAGGRDAARPGRTRAADGRSRARWTTSSPRSARRSRGRRRRRRCAAPRPRTGSPRRAGSVGWRGVDRGAARRQRLAQATPRGGRGGLLHGQSASSLVVAVEHLPALLLAAEPALAADLARSRLAPLDALGPGPRERLVETLRAWLDRPGQVQAVAAELDVHPQTVRYRLKQLRELFGERLEDPEARFELSLALRAADGVRYT